MQSFDVTGMTCSHCAAAITESIRYVDPEAKVAVDLDTGKVVVTDETAPEAVLLEAIVKEGYDATPTGS